MRRTALTILSLIVLTVGACTLAATSLASASPITASTCTEGTGAVENTCWDGTKCRIAVYWNGYLVGYRNAGPWHTKNRYGVYPGHETSGPTAAGLTFVLVDAKCFGSAPAAVAKQENGGYLGYSFGSPDVQAFSTFDEGVQRMATGEFTPFCSTTYVNPANPAAKYGSYNVIAILPRNTATSTFTVTGNVIGAAGENLGVQPDLTKTPGYCNEFVQT